MSKKSKKAETQHNEAINTAKENEIEVTHEVVPATIVEASEAVVFESQAEEQSGTQEVVPEQTAEKPSPKPKVDRRPYIAFLTEALEEPQDRKSLLKTILERWPTVSKGGCQTFLTDMLNPKYSHFKGRPVIKLADGKVVFADKAPDAGESQEVPAGPSPVEVVPEAPTEGFQAEQRGE